MLGLMFSKSGERSKDFGFVDVFKLGRYGSGGKPKASTGLRRPTPALTLRWGPGH